MPPLPHPAPPQLNDPAAQDSQIEAAVSAVVDGLFCVLATLGVVPIMRCPKGGAAEHVAAALDAKLRDALAGRTSLFSEAGAGLAASLHRPLLCLFDRNFELSVVLQHAWTYKPLVRRATLRMLCTLRCARCAAHGDASRCSCLAPCLPLGRTSCFPCPARRRRSTTCCPCISTA